MAKKKATRRATKKRSVKDLKSRKDIKGGLISTRLGVRRPLGIT